jgi:hypothetical protein
LLADGAKSSNPIDTPAACVGSQATKKNAGIAPIRANIECARVIVLFPVRWMGDDGLSRWSPEGCGNGLKQGIGDRRAKSCPTLSMAAVSKVRPNRLKQSNRRARIALRVISHSNPLKLQGIILCSTSPGEPNCSRAVPRGDRTVKALDRFPRLARPASLAILIKHPDKSGISRS